jgi:cyclin H
MAPTNLAAKATSIQFIKRFYLTNSVMSYHPLQIMTTALFLATKTENHYISLKDYASILSQVPGLEKVTGEDILAPEYILTQGLRFCFDVRHPHRALKGAYIELQLLLSLAKGDATPATWRLKGGEKEMQKRLLATYGTPAKFGQRIERTYGKARETLQGPAILSDAYFLYTPSQIMMAALWIADEGLLTDLVEFKFSMPPPNPSSSASESSELPSRPPVGKVLNEIKNCAKLLQSVRFDDTQLKKDATRVDRKLHFCRNPEMLDLVGLNQAQKRDASKDGLLDENLAKKRKLERERSLKEAEDVFGPSL